MAGIVCPAAEVGNSLELVAQARFLPGLWLMTNIGQEGALASGLPGRAVGKTLSICLINPKFEPSYWGGEFGLSVYPGNKRAVMTPGALPTLAALCAGHSVRLLDENVEEIRWGEMGGYDLVGVTGMQVQRRRMREILGRLRELGVFTAVGGPWASVKEEDFAGRSDVLFVGEAEDTLPAFLATLAAGRPTENRYEAAEHADMSKAPRPRYDLLKVGRYATGSLQFSRGCPFNCEFCDIPLLYGRRPRLKAAAAVLAELDDMRQAGFRSAAFADDNFIGNKGAAKELLGLIADWQESNGYPLKLAAQASVNLADDQPLLDLMHRANFRHVFLGIETPSAASLRETNKLQNLVGDSLESKLERIHGAGLDISGGFIVGFDSDDAAIFGRQFRFIQEAGILQAMVGILSAIPKTPLYIRLENEGRLVHGDPNRTLVPLQMTWEELRDGYWALMGRLYEPRAFMERHMKVMANSGHRRRRAEICARAGEGRFWPTLGFGLALLWGLLRALVRDGALLKVGGAYWRCYQRQRREIRDDVIGFAIFVNRCATHWHYHKFTREVRAGRLRLYNSG